LLERIEAYNRSPRPEHAQPGFDVSDGSETSRRVESYFKTSGFSRWAAIYGDGGLPPIWRIIREGHDRVIEQVVDWIQDDRCGTALDAGCGTGKLSVQLADCGYEVHGFDISAPMVSLARHLNQDRSSGNSPKFFVGNIADVQSRGGTYELVCCLDVLFHYPYAEVKTMLERLSSLCERKLIGTFALGTPFNALWMEVGKRFFHKKNRMTNLFMLSYDQVEQVLYRAGFRITRTRRVKRFFYDSFVFEAIRR
jgi:magnesium-protoporphyrin O-methyltransferase